MEDVLRIEIKHGGGVLVLDPNSLVMAWLYGGLRELSPASGVVSALTGSPAVVYRSSSVEVALTVEELQRLVALDLRPAEMGRLRELCGDCFEWHEDFYDPYTGEAMQPRGRE